MKDFTGKYYRRAVIDLPNRQWPNKHIDHPPIWCSVDLRDGNQALAVPMSVDEKIRLYKTLLKIGFKEIEVGFPAASETEFNFLRRLVDDGLVPDDVTVQVLTQARQHLIKKTFESLRGCKTAIVHLYNSTSPLQRKVTFNKSAKEIIEIAKDGVKLVRDMAAEAEQNGTKIRLEYSPESFSDTELEFALEICEEVKSIWKPTPENKMIVNLPETVQYNPPNVYADQIEWISTHISQRDCVEISLHSHNDRGTGVASTELGIMAGADRVEGTLFGNGERTGNVDIVTVALNMHAEGVESGLDFSDLPAIRKVYEECTKMQVPPRHPYAGDLVFTAFSGSHQDAIKKGMDLRKRQHISRWEVPYLMIDPTDIGCSYEAIIRINSQSGKGGVAYVLADKYGLDLPKAMHQEVGDFINSDADKEGKELSPEEIYKLFKAEFVDKTSPLRLVSYSVSTYGPEDSREVKIIAKLLKNGEEIEISAVGNGPVNAFVNALEKAGLKDFKLVDYCSHAIGSGSATNSAAYICLESRVDGHRVWGVGLNSNIEHAALDALVCAYNRLR